MITMNETNFVILDTFKRIIKQLSYDILYIIRCLKHFITSYDTILNVIHLLFVEAVNMENSHLLHYRTFSTFARTLERKVIGYHLVE